MKKVTTESIRPKWRQVFLKTLKSIPNLVSCCINTPLGKMIALADETFLYSLEFLTQEELVGEIEQGKKDGQTIPYKQTPPLLAIESELNLYFSGKLKVFNTPYRVFGSPFQETVWKSLCNIPYGETKSYAEQSQSIGKPTAYRAVANANGANPLALIIPCHRVIGSHGRLGGYRGGVNIKMELLAHEKQYP